MTEKSHYNPLVKQQLLKQLKIEIYAPIVNSLNREFWNINRRNTVKCGFNHNVFTYRGIFYSGNILIDLNLDYEDYYSRINTHNYKEHLATEFHIAFDDLLAKRDLISEKEMPLVMGYVTQVLNISNNPHNYLKLLPDTLHKCIRIIAPFSEDVVDTISPARIENIKTVNKEYIDLLKLRLMSNLLLV